jgi:hypothetical protein
MHAKRVGDSFQDTMGFTVVGPGRFLGSGHPDAQSDEPPLLGLVESRDAGKSWRPVALSGKADFHVLRAVGDSVVGYDSSNNRLMRLGPDRTLTKLRTPRGTLIDLAVDPEDERHYVAAADTGIYESHDGGGAGRAWIAGARACSPFSAPTTSCSSGATARSSGAHHVAPGRPWER